MRKLLTWIVRIIVLLLLLQIALWSWDRYRQGAGNAGQKEVLDGDKICRITNPGVAGSGSGPHPSRPRRRAH